VSDFAFRFCVYVLFGGLLIPAIVVCLSNKQISGCAFSIFQKSKSPPLNLCGSIEFSLEEFSLPSSQKSADLCEIFSSIHRKK
jgi:hypothetical protein